MSPSIVIAGGGTGGHVYPGLALADALRRIDTDITVSFVGTARGLEASAVPAAGYPLDLIDVVPFSRSVGSRRYLAPFIALRATRQAIRIVRTRRASAVACMGGYAGLPVCLAARRAHIPIIVHEQNAVPGRVNRIAGRLTRHIAVTFSSSAKAFNRTVLVTGNPLREAIASMDRASLRAEAFTHFGLDPSRPVLLIFGGSQGARRLNEAVRVFAAGAQDLNAQFLLITGRGNADPASTTPSASANPSASTTPFASASLIEIEFTDRMELAYAAADLAVARAGAGLMEIACAGIPSILVPYPYAKDAHQAANAREAERAGAAVVVAESDDLAADLGAQVRRIFGDATLRESMADAARRFAKPRAADELAEFVLKVAEGS